MNRQTPLKNGLSLLALIIIVGVLVSGDIYIDHFLDTNRELTEELNLNSKNIEYYDEVLTMSARMAALTGDISWENRYRIYEKKLDESINTILTIMPKEVGLQATEETEKANTALIEMENNAFHLVKKGEKEKAIDLLLSPEYKEFKKIYNESNKTLEQSIERYTDDMEEWHDRVLIPVHLAIIAAGITLLLSSVYYSFHSREKFFAQQKISLEYLRMATVGKFSSGIAHEINNALQPIMGLSEIIANGLEKEKTIDPRFAEYAQIIHKSSKHGRDVIENILSVARGSTSQLEPWKAKELFCEALDFASKILPPTIKLDKDITALDKGDYSLVVNKTDVSRIFTNLLKNASYAMGDRGEINIQLDVKTLNTHMAKMHDINRGDFIVMSIRDTGTGMDDKTLASIFNPFFTTKDSGEGIGLGLSMSYGIMRQYGGTIIVESKLNKGSTFNLYFPVV